MKIVDPIEKIIADALDGAGISYRHESDGAPLDFAVGDVLIEVKQFHSERTNAQLSKHHNVILVQGITAACWFARSISNGVLEDGDDLARSNRRAGGDTAQAVSERSGTRRGTNRES